MTRRRLPQWVLGSLLLVGLIGGLGATAEATAPTPPAQGRNFDLVGHDPLFARGMNAAPAVYGQYVYVGSRTDASSGHPHAGVLVVDATDPAHPQTIGEIGPPNEGNIGETSRELRVWPQQKLLIVMNFSCSAFIHACADVPVTSTFKFYDLTGVNARAPRLIATYVPPRKPHEMFLWVDPNNPARALLYYTTPTNDLNFPNLIVTDISQARTGVFPEIATFNANRQYPAAVRAQRDVALHSISLTPDGRTAFLAYLGGGFVILDTSAVARGVASPRVRLITPVANRIPYTNPGAHSAVKVPGRPYVVLTEEVYGDLLDAPGDNEGCPWGWVKIVDIRDPRHPVVVGQYRIEQDTKAYCASPAGQDPKNTTWTSYSAHNPTVLPDLALVTWHSGGLQAISIVNPSDPVQTGFFLPRPLDRVATEDPALSLGTSKVVMWSYPIIARGLIYVVDIRNGLYILRYTGPHAAEVARIHFLEGNSNLGDAMRLG